MQRVNDPAIVRARIVAVDVEFHRCHGTECTGCAQALLETSGYPATLFHAAGERIGAEVLQREPDFQRPEAVQEFRAEIAWPHFARGKSGFSAGEIGICRGECLFVCFTILNQQISYVIGRMGPVVKIKPNGIGAINAAS